MLNSLTMERVWTKLTVLRMSHWKRRALPHQRKGITKTEMIWKLLTSIGNANVHVQNDARFVETPPYDIPLIPKGRTDDESHFLKVGRMLQFNREMRLLRVFCVWLRALGVVICTSQDHATAPHKLHHITLVARVLANSMRARGVPFYISCPILDRHHHAHSHSYCLLGNKYRFPNWRPQPLRNMFNIKLHVLKPQSTAIVRLLQHSVIIRYYCHKILQEIEALLHQRRGFDPEEADSGAVVGVAVRKMKGINPKDVNLERLGISEALDYLTGFPYYR